MHEDEPHARGAEEPLDFSGRRLTHVQPGQVLVSARARSFVTIVGSCVSVCVYDATARVGGLNHFLLPRYMNDSRSPRFAPGAMRQLLDAAVAEGARLERLVAKVFGGACVLGQGISGGRHLGRENVEAALEFLAAAAVPVVAEDVGGTRGRKLIYHSDTGDTWVRRL